MANEIAVAYVSIVPSARGFGRSLSRDIGGVGAGIGSSIGDDASRSMHSRITSGFSRTVSGLVSIAKTGGLLIGAGLAGAAGFGIKVAADFEQTRIAFEGILGDINLAALLLAQLRNFANTTPFEFAGLADSAKNLLAVGFGADEIIPTMTTLGNVAATLGVGEAEIAGVVRALGQMKGKGKASAEELQQISEQFPGFSAVKAIAEDMGISVAAAFKAMALGQIPAEEAIESILNSMEDFPGAAGAMERQSKTLNGVISTFKDTLSTTAIDFITPYLPQLASGVTRFSGFITDTIVPGLQTTISFIGDMVDRWGPGIADFAGRVVDVMTMVVRYILDHVIPTVKGIATDGFEAIKSWWDRNGETVTGFFTTVARVAGKVLTAIGDWIWKTALPALNDFRDWFVNNETAIVGVLAAIAAGFTAWAVSAAIAAISTALAYWPIVLLIAAVGLLAAGIFYAYTHFDWFRHAVDIAVISVLMLIPALQQVYGWVKTLIKGFQNAISFFDDLLNKIPGTGGNVGVFDIVKGAIPGLNLTGLAGGGKLQHGQPTIVGEYGPELYTQGGSGYITPLAEAGMGGGDTFVIHQYQPEPTAMTVAREQRRKRMLAAA